MITDVFLNQKRVKVSEHKVKTAPCVFWISATTMGTRQKEGRSGEGGGDGGKIEWKSSDVDTRTVVYGTEQINWLLQDDGG